ncbi:MAG TPA: hypothetical protein VJP76_01940 [Candidatus Tumulicola sp.]|nr:hypothetical protein [Candidatus Tumulicola sp.]
MIKKKVESMPGIQYLAILRVPSSKTEMRNGSPMEERRFTAASPSDTPFQLTAGAGLCASAFAPPSTRQQKMPADTDRRTYRLLRVLFFRKFAAPLRSVAPGALSSE